MFKKLSETLKDKYGRKDELSKQLQIVEVFNLFRKELELFLGKNQEVKPVSLKNKTLVVKTPSSVTANQLYLHESEIIKKINNCLGKEVIKRMVYRF